MVISLTITSGVTQGCLLVPWLSRWLPCGELGMAGLIQEGPNLPSVNPKYKYGRISLMRARSDAALRRSKSFTDTRLRLKSCPEPGSHHNDVGTFLLCLGWINPLRLRQDGHHFADGIFKSISFNEKVKVLIQISQKFVLKGPIHNKPALVQIMAWLHTGDKPLSEPMMAQFTHAYMCLLASMS